MHLDLLIGRERPLAWVLRFWPVLAAAFASSLVATALCKRVALRFGIVEKPDNLVKMHVEPVPYLGGAVPRAPNPKHQIPNQFKI